MNIAPTLSKTIEATLEAYVNNPEPDLVNFDPPLNMRKLAAELNLLPVLRDMGGCYGLRPNGEIFSFVWDEPYQLRIERDVRIQNLVLFQGAKSFPDLAEMVPARPPDARECEFCKGTGRADGLSAELAESVLCYCGGLGWVP